MVESVRFGESEVLTDYARDVEELLDGLEPASDYLGNNHTWISLDNTEGSYQLAKTEGPDGVISYSLMHQSLVDEQGMVESHQYTWSESRTGHILLKCPEAEMLLRSVGPNAKYERTHLSQEQIAKAMPDIITTFFQADRSQCIHNGTNAISG